MEDVRNEIVIAPHHPDRLRRPALNPATAGDEKALHALTWNVFRTLELLPPAFWLRRLHARLFGAPFTPAPEIVRICLWRRLPLPPARRLDGRHPDVLVDAVIETEHALWALTSIIASDRQASETLTTEFVADVLDAASWRAGARRSYMGFIEAPCNTGVGSLWKTRYSRSHASTTIRAARGSTASAAAHPGVLRWPDLAAILYECTQADVLSEIDRSLARNAVDWLARCGLGCLS